MLPNERDRHVTHLIGGHERTGLITNEFGQPASPMSLTPVLVDSQVQRLADAAESLVKALRPAMDIKLSANSKKRLSKELEVWQWSRLSASKCETFA